MTRTRFKELGLIRQDRTTWRFIDLSDDPEGKRTIVIGQQYRTKTEALCDLENYARDYGLTP